MRTRTRTAIAVMLVACFLPCVSARNVIMEWGGHTSSDYQIELDIYGNNVGVTILGNTQPDLVWKFEAYDYQTHDPGYIDYIYINPGISVGGIKLSVIAQPPYEYGAENLDLLNLVDYGMSTNIVEVIDIAGDCGVDGDILAYGADSITIGGNLGPYGIHILGAVTGDIHIGGAGPHTGSLIIDESAGMYDGDIYFGGSMNGDIELGDSWNGPIEVNGDLGGMTTVAGDADSAWTLSVHNITKDAGVDVAGDFHGRVLWPGGWGELRGSFHVGGNLGSAGWLTRALLGDTGWIEIDGNLSGSIDVTGDIGSTGSIAIGETAAYDVTRTLAVHGDVAGSIYLFNSLGDPLAVGTLGHIMVDGSLLATGDIDIDGTLRHSDAGTGTVRVPGTDSLLCSSRLVHGRPLADGRGSDCDAHC